MLSYPNVRTVYIVSDSTGITAETFSQSVLSQFDSVNFRLIRLPFIDTLEKADEVVDLINQNAIEMDVPPIVFSTLVHSEILARIRQSTGVFLDLFGTFVDHIEQTLGIKSSHSIGLSHCVADTKKYRNRIEAINFALAHDDGQYVNNLGQADVILIGVSRCGKTPTSLYLSMQYAIKAANYPLTPDDFERGVLPSTLIAHRKKLFGLSIHTERLAEVRHERRAEGQYATLKQCQYEVIEAERMMRREQIAWLSTTTRSIEEIATKIMQKIGLDSKL